MRRHCFKLLTISALVLAAGGCRQTTGPAGGTLSPLGSFAPSNSLLPVAPGQTPKLGPFGGATRVTPPPTGSFSNPGNAPSGIAPTSGYAPLNSLGQAGPQNDGRFASPSAQPMGSGIQQTTWTETGTSVGNPASPLLSNPQTSNPHRDPRSGGMQVIDLTGAPHPPGYSPSAGLGPLGPRHTASPIASPSLTTPSLPAAFQPAPLHAVQTPPISYPSTAPQFVPRSGPGSAQSGPVALPHRSTATLPRDASGGNLNWRRPGSQF